ncbi:MAG: DUF2953 domain-containing protein [Oscillospiraceae bacterium]|nr:DUF2953 domain-containing protein [Oscillospiraceae bacterium]
MGWSIFFLIVFLLAILPLGASVKYDQDGPLVRILAGPIRFTVFPVKKKEKPKKDDQPEFKTNKKEEEKKKAAAVPAEAGAAPSKAAQGSEKKGGSLLDFLPLVQVGLDFLGDFRRKLRIDVLYLKLTMAGDDPCDLAVNYGRTWAIVGDLFPLLERCFVIKKRDIQIQCDFTASETLVTARLDITITLGRIIALAVRYGVRALVEFLKISKSRKGGANK